MFSVTFAALALVGTLVTPPIPTDRPDTSAEIPASCDRSGTMRLALSVEGGRPRTFILDTGSSLSFVDDEIASTLQLPDAGRIASGGGFARLVGVKVTVAGVTLPMLSVVSGDRSSLNGMLAKSDAGIIGNDVIRALERVTVDYARCRVIVGARPVSKQSTRVRLEWHQGRPIVRSADGGRLLLDSGASILTVFNGSPAAATFRSASGPAPLVQIRRVYGDTVGRLGFIPSLALGSVELSNVAALGVASWYGKEPDAPDGLVPLSLFSSVHFNSVEGYAILTR